MWLASRTARMSGLKKIKLQPFVFSYSFGLAAAGYLGVRNVSPVGHHKHVTFVGGTWAGRLPRLCASTSIPWLKASSSGVRARGTQVVRLLAGILQSAGRDGSLPGEFACQTAPASGLPSSVQPVRRRLPVCNVTVCPSSVRNCRPPSALRPCRTPAAGAAPSSATRTPRHASTALHAALS